MSLPLTDSLVSYWSMEGNSNDLVGSNNGTDTNISYSTGTGKILQGMSPTSTASGTGISIPNAAALRTTGDFTISLWFNLSANQPAGLFCGGGQSASTYNNYSLSYFNGQGILWRIRDNGGGLPVNIIYAFSTLSAWTHVVAMISGTAATLYVNGAVVGTGTFSGTRNSLTNTNNIGGGFHDSNERIIQGDIDEVGFWSRALSQNEVTELYNAGRALAYPLAVTVANSLVSYYKLDGNSSDSIGGNNGTDTAISYSTANGKLIQGAGMNGTTSNITSASSAFAFNGNITVSAWVNPSAIPTTGNFMSLIARFTNTAGQFGYDLRLECPSGVNTVNFNIVTAGSVNVVCSVAKTLTLGTWYHLMGINDGTNSYLYINGALAATTVGINDGIATNNLYFGAINYNAGITRYFSGAIDEIGIWRRALTASEVTQIYNNGVGLQYPFNGMSGSFLLKMV